MRSAESGCEVPKRRAWGWRVEIVEAWGEWGYLQQEDTKRVITFANQADFISLRHHTYSMPRGAKSTALTECGPRCELKLYQIRLGTLEQSHAENEWVVRAYTRSAKKSKLAETGD